MPSKNIEDRRAQSRRYRAKHYDKLHSPEYIAKQREYSHNAWIRMKENPVEHEAKKAEDRRYRRQWRRELIALYGGECACCGECTFEFLAIDHIEGEGRKQRRTIEKSKEMFYVWLAKEKRPGFRVLCHNCNQARGFYGYCPHEKAPRIWT